MTGNYHTGGNRNWPQDIFRHEIIAGDEDVDINAVRYSFTFRRVSWRFHNSTVIIGDSNTEKLAFCDVDDTKEKANGTFGRAMPGMRAKGYLVNEIDPSDALGYSNVVLLCGINSIKGRAITSREDIKGIFEPCVGR